MLTRLRCSLGHDWEPSESSAAPLVCPQCGRPPVTRDAPRAAAPAARDEDQTLDMTPAPEAPPASEVTQTMHFTPPPSPPMPAGSSTAGQSAVVGGSANRGKAPATGTPAQMPFSIIRQHARGGLGVVNLARDINIKREVALKQILPQHVDNGVLKRRFLYEAQITGQLEHPSIVPVYCLGHDEQAHPYYVMRFVKGRTLDEHIKDFHAFPNPIVFRELLSRFIAVCQAVAYAHSRSVIHRDLKPANVMLGDYGETLVLDWGLAKDIRPGAVDPMNMSTGDANATSSTIVSLRPAAGEKSVAPGASTAGGPSQGGASQAGRSQSLNSGTLPSTAELTAHGQIIGTPAYMAPEQAEGRTELHGPVTDIYALGGILYKILTGQSPQAPAQSTHGDSGQRKFTWVASPPPTKVNKDVDPILESICLRAMHPDPQARFPRALELAEEIKRWLYEHPLSYKTPTLKDKVSNALKPVLIPLLIGLVGIIAVLVTLLVLRK